MPPNPRLLSLRHRATLATDLKTVWTDPETDARLKKRIVRILIQEVIADIDQEAAEIVLIIHWMGGVVGFTARHVWSGSGVASAPRRTSLATDQARTR
ncbi:MAG TPA: hypothetical protein VIY68_06195 [Steroidobacteraceae bacterium]